MGVISIFGQPLLSFFVCHVDLSFLVHVVVLFRVLVISAARDAPDPKKGQDTAANKLSDTCRSCLLKVAVQYCTSHDDEDGEHDKLRRNYLGRVETL